MKVDVSKWELKTLGDVCTFKRGLTYPKSEESAVITSNVVLRSNNIDLNTCALVFNELKYLSDSYTIPNERKLVKDSILMCMSNGSSAHIGKVAYIDNNYDYAFGGFMGLIIPKDINPKFLYYKYRSESFKTFLGKIGNGINITNLKFSSISPLPIYVPTLAEQEVIVRELNALQEMIDGYKAHISDFDELAKSLFLDTLGDPVINEKKWQIKSLSSLCNKMSTGPFGSMLHKSDYVVKGIPSVNPQNIKGSKVVIDGIAKVSYQKAEELSKYYLKENDIILARRGDLSKCAIITPKEQGWLCGTGSFFLHIEEVLPIVFYYQFTSKSIQKQLLEKSIGATMPNLNQGILSKLMIPVPPIDVQQKFASQIEAIEKQKAILREQLADAEQLIAERMQYYFS